MSAYDTASLTRSMVLRCQSFAPRYDLVSCRMVSGSRGRHRAEPSTPVPAACQEWGATKAAYRFFDNSLYSRELRASFITNQFRE